MVVMEVMEVEVDDVDVVGLALGLEGEEGRGMKLAAITQPGSVSGQEGRCSFISGGGLAGLALHSALKGVTAQISWVQSCLLASLLQVSRRPHLASPGYLRQASWWWQLGARLPGKHGGTARRGEPGQ